MNRKICTALVVGCIYRPPDQPKDNFIDNFSESLSKIDSGFDKVVLADFDIDFLEGEMQIRLRNDCSRELSY